MELILNRADFIKASLGSTLSPRTFSTDRMRETRDDIEHHIKEAQLNSFDKFVLGEHDSRLVKGLAVIFGVVTGGVIYAGVTVKLRYILRDAPTETLKTILCDGIDNSQIKPGIKEAYKAQINSLSLEELETIRDAAFQVYSWINDQTNAVFDGRAIKRDAILWVSNNQKEKIEVKDGQLRYCAGQYGVVLIDKAHFVSFSLKSARPDKGEFYVQNLHCASSQLCEVNLSRLHLIDSNFRDAQLSDVTLADSCVEGKVSFARSILNQVNLTNLSVIPGAGSMDLSGAILRMANISDTNFKNMILNDVSISLLFPEDNVESTLSSYLNAIHTIPHEYKELKAGLLRQIMQFIVQDGRISDQIKNDVQTCWNSLCKEGAVSLIKTRATTPLVQAKKEVKIKIKPELPLPGESTKIAVVKEPVVASTLDQATLAELKKTIQRQHPAESGSIKVARTDGQTMDVVFKFKACGAMTNIYDVTVGESISLLEIKWTELRAKDLEKSTVNRLAVTPEWPLDKNDHIKLKREIESHSSAESGTIKLSRSNGEIIDVAFKLEGNRAMSSVYSLSFGQLTSSLEIAWPGFGRLNQGKTISLKQMPIVKNV